MSNNSTGTDKSSTFGRQLMSYISNKLPYNYKVIDVMDEKNPKYDIFQKSGLRRAELLAKHSISLSNDYNNQSISSIERDNTLQKILYANIQGDKGARLRDYRIMAAFSDVADAMDEICDEFINKDENGDIVKLAFKHDGLTDRQQENLRNEFQKIVTLFDLDNKGWTYIRQFLIEGELFFENIIHEQHTKEGILGVINLPAELIDPVYNNIQNMSVKGYIYRKPIFDPTKPNTVQKYDLIPLNENQIVYVNSGIFNEQKTFVLPILENARRAYRQLSLIEDAIVIYRMVRAPERLVFNVDVGNMSPPKAESYLKKLIQQYWSSKSFDSDQNDVVNKFNPQSMLDAYWFAKRQGSEGTSVTQLAGGQNLGELSDLMYFIKKLYRSLKVPTTRLDPEDAFRDGADILREELKFARFIIRMQQRIAAGIKRCFITHLKLRGVWDDFELTEYNISVDFNVPTNFYDLRENQKLEIKASNFSNLASNEYISNTFAQKKYLGWNDTDVLANREFLRKDAELAWELEQIKGMGPGWKQALAAGSTAPAGGGMGPESMGIGGGGGGGGGSIPPEFGGGEAAVEGEGEAPPEGGKPATSTEQPPTEQPTA